MSSNSLGKMCGNINNTFQKKFSQKGWNYVDRDFVQDMCNDRFCDIVIIFDDGKLEVNRAAVASMSRNIFVAMEDCHDVVKIPDVKVNNFLSFLDLLSVEKDHQTVSVESLEIIKLLKINILDDTNHFKETLKQKPKENILKIHTADTETAEQEGASKSEEVETKTIERFSSEDISSYPDCVQIEVHGNQLQLKSEYSLDNVVCQWLQCPDCHQDGYSTMSGIIDHIRSSHEWTHSLIHCTYCDQPFREKTKCIKHELHHCKNTNNICFKCGEYFNNKTLLLEHLLLRHHQGKVRKCQHCDKTFLAIVPHFVDKWPHLEACFAEKNKRNSKKPVGRPKGSFSRKSGKKICDDCGGTFVDSWKHKRQCTAVNSDIKYICHECRKGFRRLGAVKKHFKLSKKCKLNVENQEEFEKLMKYVENDIKGRTVCQDCGCEYVTRKGPQEHRKNCAAVTQFKCFSCNRGINAIDGFHIHFAKFPACREAPENAEILAEIVARSQKPEFHVCYLCGAQYKAKESFEKHMRTHAEHVEYFTCVHVDCGKKFITQKALDLHLKNHTMPKVICSICGKQVKQGSMPLHMILHTGKKTECNICGKMFQHKGVLNKHIKSAHSDNKSSKQKPKITDKRTKNDTKEGVPKKQTNQNIPHSQLQHTDGSNNVRIHLPSIQSISQHQNYQQNIILPSVPVSSILNHGNMQTFLQNNQGQSQR